MFLSVVLDYFCCCVVAVVVVAAAVVVGAACGFFLQLIDANRESQESRITGITNHGNHESQESRITGITNHRNHGNHESSESRIIIIIIARRPKPSIWVQQTHIFGLCPNPMNRMGGSLAILWVLGPYRQAAKARGALLCPFRTPQPVDSQELL